MKGVRREIGLFQMSWFFECSALPSLIVEFRLRIVVIVSIAGARPARTLFVACLAVASKMHGTCIGGADAWHSHQWS